MKSPSVSMTRRKAVAAIAAAASTAIASPAQARPATILKLEPRSPKELLLKVALTRDHIFGEWSTGLVRGSSRLACYDLNGNQKWSTEPNPSSRFSLVASGDDTITEIAIDRATGRLNFSRYSSLGALNQVDSLSLDVLNGAVLAASASGTGICALDLSTNIIKKHFGSQEAPAQLPRAFDTPVIGGIMPRATMASMHFVGDQLLLLDHVKARAVVLFPNGERRAGELTHAPLVAAI